MKLGLALLISGKRRAASKTLTLPPADWLPQHYLVTVRLYRIHQPTSDCILTDGTHGVSSMDHMICVASVTDANHMQHTAGARDC